MSKLHMLAFQIIWRGFDMHTEYYFQDITMTLKKNLPCFRNSQMTKEVVLIFFQRGG